MKKRILSAVLVLVMLITWLPTFTLPTKAEDTNAHVFDCTTDVTAGQDKDPIAEGTIFGGYFKVIGTVTQRYKAEKGIYAVEIAKALTGALQFSTAAVADLTMVVSSTGGSNESAVGLQNMDTEEIIFSQVVSGTGETTLTIEDLPAGTYRIVSPVDAERGRGFRLMRVTVAEEAAEPVITVHTLDSSLDFTPFSGTKEDNETEVINDYFTLIYRNNSKVEAKEKTFEDNYSATQRLSLNGKTDLNSMKGSIMFTTSAAATVKLWWIAGGNNRNMAIYDADKNLVVETDTATSAKDAQYIDTFQLDNAGTYYLATPNGNNYIFRIEVTEYAGGHIVATRKDWAEVAAPNIVSAADDGEGHVNVTVDAVVGKDGGDMLTVTMYDSEGNAVDSKNSLDEKQTQHVLEFSPAASGNYTFKAALLRTDAAPKETAATEPVPFKLLLAAPIIISGTSKGGGTVDLVWAGVKEATGYEIYAEDTLLGSTEGNTFMAEGLTIDRKYAFTIVAIRGEDRTTSEPISVTVTQDAKQTWGFTAYGPSANASKNGYTGSLNEDGYVTVYSNGGKIQPNSHDGLAFYYTAVPASLNFTLRAKVTVDSWSYDNGQEGFGLMVADQLGTSGNTDGFYNNSYMALATKVEYWYIGDEEDSLHIYNTKNDSAYKITMKLGLGALEKVGVTPENQANFSSSDALATYGLMSPLEWAAAKWGKEPGVSYNIVGNYKPNAAPSGDIELEMLTEFILEIQKNNTGYFITYYDANGNILCRQKYYDPDALSQLDKDYVYAGFFASRNVQATFSDVVFTTIDPKDDAPAEERPITEIEPTLTFVTDPVSNSLDYEMTIDSNVSGTAKITVAGKTVLENIQIVAYQRVYLNVPLAAFGKNRVQVIFSPDPNQELPPYTVLSSTKDLTETLEVMANKGNYHQKVIFVSPTGLPTGNGTKERPYDICTAVDNVVAGQTIVLMEGTYKMLSNLRIKRGIDGTADAPINMIADPEAKTRPVIDFQGLYDGITHGGDYWYFYGFDVTRSLNDKKGFQVSGNYNTLDQINAYYNGNTGIQISRYHELDPVADWPCNNLILNCTSYCNYDKGFEDGDGFAAKLTIGEGNVFDGCVAYNNADDGWDLYAKLATGPIGAVTIRNCVAYNNGWVPGIEDRGNGNGFKLGGDSLTGKHVLENSYAFWNLAKGIDSNSCPDITVKNCVSYNNGSYNVAFYTNGASNTDFSATGIVSFKDSTHPYADGMIEEQLKPKGTQDTSKYANATNYYWDGSVSANTAGVKITADMFISLQFNGITRNADGSINMQGFLQLNETAPAGVGVPADAGSASQNPTTLPENPAHDLPDAWSYLDRLSGHWHECECGFKADLADHTFQWVIDSEPTPTANGQKHEECTVCGYKSPAVETYYEGPVPADPTDPTDPTEPSTQPSVPATTVSQSGNQGGNNTVIIVIAVILVVAIGAFVVFKFVIKKKEN